LQTGQPVGIHIVVSSVRIVNARSPAGKKEYMLRSLATASDAGSEMPYIDLDAYLGEGGGARGRIIAAAARLFRERGYQQVTMQDVAGAIGLSKAGLYHHCPSKDLILADIVGLCGQILTRQLQTASEAEGTPLGRLQRFVVTRMETIAQYQDFFTIVYQERPYLGTSTFGSIAKSAEIYRAGVRDLIEDCKACGQLRADIDAHLMMLAIDGMTGWAYVWFRDDGTQNPTRIGESFWSFLMNGVHPVEPLVAGRDRPRRNSE